MMDGAGLVEDRVVEQPTGNSIDEDAFHSKEGELGSSVGSIASAAQLTRKSTVLKPKSKASYIVVALLCVNAAWGGFLFGYDIGTISGFLNMESFIYNFGNTNDAGEHYFSKIRSGLIVGIFSIGAAVGGIVLGRVGDLWGRKAGIYMGAAIYVVGVCIQISARRPRWYQYLVGRIIGGAGIGQLSVVIPAFQSETAPQQIRGMLVSSWQLMITLGIFIGYCVNYGAHHRTDRSAYQIPIGLGYVWSFLLVVAVMFMPESPRWLLQKDKIDEAAESLSFINRRPVNDPGLQMTLDRIYEGVQEERKVGKASWKELLTGKPMIAYRLMCGIYILAFQQLNGVNYFLYFGTTIFKAVGQANTFASSMVFGGVTFGSTFFGLIFVDKFGRRKVLIWGAAGMLVFLIIYTVLGVRALYPNNDMTQHARGAVGRTMVAVTNLYLFCFSASWGPAAFVIVSEIFPLRIRSKGMAIGLGANWIGNFLLAFFTPFIAGAINFWYGFVFAFNNFMSMVFVFLFLHESKGLSLEQIELMYQSHVLPWLSSGWVPPKRKALPAKELQRQTIAENMPS